MNTIKRLKTLTIAALSILLMVGTPNVANAAVGPQLYERSHSAPLNKIANDKQAMILLFMCIRHPGCKMAWVDQGQSSYNLAASKSWWWWLIL